MESSPELDLSIITLLSEAGIGTWSWDPATGAVHWDDTTFAIYGVDRATFDGTFEAYASLIHRDDVAHVTELIGGLAERGGQYSIKHRIIHPSGAVRWIEGQGRIVAEDGDAISGFGVVYDVTDRATIEAERDRLRVSERAAQAARTATEQDLAYLIEVSDAFSGSLNVARVLERVCTALVPGLADRCIVQVRADDPANLIHTVRYDGTGQVRVETLPSAPSTQGRLARPTGRLTDAERRQWELEVSDGNNATALCYSLQARGTRIGTIVVERHDGMWSSRSESLIEVISRRAAIALDNSALFQQHTRVTGLLTSAVRPERLAVPPALQVASHYQAATELHRIGGDFYDFFELSPTQWIATIGDITGKGIVAAAQAGMLKSAVRSAAIVSASPTETVRAMNSYMRMEVDRPMATLAVTLFEIRPDGHHFTVASAGHPAGIVVGPNRRLRHIQTSGELLGFVDEPSYTEAHGILEPGDTLLLYSDGITEARLGTEQFGLDRLTNAALEVAEEGAKAVVTAVAAAVDAWTTGRTQDDLTLLAATAR